MRILLAQNSLYYPAHGGGDKSNRLLMEALAARGHTCRVVARISVFGELEHNQYLAELARRYPTAKIEYVNLPREADAPVSARLLASGSNESGWADIDAVHGTAGALQPDSSQARTLLYGLHERLLLADVGPWVLRAVALTALVLVAMGLRVWWRVRRLPPRTPVRRLHRLIGPVFVLPVAMMLVTGFVLRSPEWAIRTVRSGTARGERARRPSATRAPRLPAHSGAKYRAPAATRRMHHRE